MSKSKGGRNQLLAALTCNLLSMVYGIACAWGGPNYILLMSDKTPLESGPLTQSEASTVVSILSVGGMIGTLLYGYLINYYERRMLLVSVAFSQIIGLALLYFATNVYFLYASRLISGLCGGACFIVIPIYVSEIADDTLRGMLGSLLVLIINVGILLLYVIDNFAGYYNQLRILVFIPILFLAIFKFFPETPEFLQKEGHILLAQKSRDFYGGAPSPVEMNDMSKSKEEKGPIEEKTYDKMESDSLTFSDFCTRAAIKSTIITIFLAILGPFCGVFVMINYSNKIFEEAGSSLSPSTSTIIVAIVQIFANFLTTMLADKAGRKLLLALSSVGSAFSLVSMGSHDQFKAQILEFSPTLHSMMPIVSFSMIILSGSIGILPLMAVIFMEILPTKIKRMMSMVAFLINWLVSFIVVQIFPSVIEMIGMSGCMFTFAICCLGGLLFTIFVIPETKGKTHDEIMKSLE